MQNVANAGSKPMISVITVCFNAGESAAITMRSVFAQDYAPFEYVIVDGASTDNTLEVISRECAAAEQKGIKATCISEPDKGVYDAMNKAVRMASGEFVVFMNAGDCFVDSHTLSTVAEGISENDEIVFADHYTFIGSKRKRHYIGFENKTVLPIFCHQASLTRRELLLQVPFSLEYRILADHVFFATVFSAGHSFRYVSEPMAYYDLTGMSSTQLKRKDIEQLRFDPEHYNMTRTEKTGFRFRLLKRRIRRRIINLLPERIRTRQYEDFSMPWRE